MTMTQNTPSQARFSDLGIAPKLLDNLERLKFVTPTPIQHQCIPHALQGKDIVGIAQTGTGKTLAFGIPMIQILSQVVGNGQGLVLLPTRELALQVDEVLQKIGRPIGLRTAVLIGGASAYQQRQMLARGPHIIVSTPGRLMDHIQQKNLTLNRMKMVVLDEADRMFDIGFMPQIKQILAMVPRERQTLMFSATMPQAIADIANRFMKTPLRIEVAPAGTSAKNVEQEIFIVNKDAKMQLLEKVLEDNKGSVLLFSRTKHGAKRIANGVRAMGHTASEIHSNKSLSQRKMALEGFKTGRFRVLVATDIASRGIDVTGISLVINYDLPDNTEDYVHRIGRTGRAQSFGKAISFASPQEWVDIRHIEKLIKKTIPVKPLPVLPPRRAVAADHYEETSGFQGRNRAPRRGPTGGGNFHGHRKPQGGGSSGGNKNFRRRY
ncbi:MAG TPA: DEAD/DEAH box helicase [Candidatus Udaeobacter sp.]|nr:DEAD/DEAH box helicase [Candidatus Udaeobacter sp.]